MKLVPALTCFVIIAACASAPETQSEKAELNADAQAAVADFKKKDSSLEKWFDEAHAYAILPTIGKGGMGIGGAHGRGQVHQGGAVIGYVTMTQATIGLQLGGQSFSQLIFFENKDALDRFTTGSFEFGAQVSAIAATAGVAANSDYSDGMAVFVLGKGGLMYEASVGGQKFEFVKK